MQRLAIAVLLALPVSAQESREKPPTDRELVHSAVLDYVEALYDVAPKRIERSVDPKLVKYGFGRRSPEQSYRGLEMTYEQLVELAGRWNAEGKVAEDAPKKIEVLDVLPHIACAKLTAQWGTDYMQLVKQDGEWRIRHVLWQTPSSPGAEAAGADRKAIERAVFDYAEAFYETKPELIDRGVHEDLAKFGFYSASAEGKLVPASMTFSQLRSLAERAYANRSAPGNPRKEVTLLDVQDKTAIVKLVGEWGLDYMHLAKFDGKWKTLHVVWQTHPREAKAVPAAADRKRKDG